MSDPINLTIAEALTAHGFDTALAWEPARECPRGHLNVGRTPIGGWCDECIVQRWEHRDEYDDAVTTISEVIAWMETFPAAISRMWRIDRIPHDFTDPRYLLPAIEAFCDQMGYGYLLHRYADPLDGIEAEIYAGPNAGWKGDAPHGQPMEALRGALHAAVTGDEKGVAE